MLNRAQITKALQEHTDKLFVDITTQLDYAKKMWDLIAQDPDFAQKAATAQSSRSLPSWKGLLSDTYSYDPQQIPPYCAIGLDGSQIYPDRHQGTLCSLINIGSTCFYYGSPTRAVLSSKPFVYFNDVVHGNNESEELINCRRQELELNEMVQLAHDYRNSKTTLPLLMLFDGALVFWHLEGKSESLKTLYAQRYIAALQQLYHLQIPLAGYISLPKSKELVSLVAVKSAEETAVGNSSPTLLDNLVDTHIAQFFLETYQRTTFFASNTPITAHYPKHLKPYFFYLKLPHEIVRIEIPAWLVDQPILIDTLVTHCIDQAAKGFGYPICLAEAHEQAVVKGPDRDFFYHMIQKIGYTQRQQVTQSQKSIKKKIVSF